MKFYIEKGKIGKIEVESDKESIRATSDISVEDHEHSLCLHGVQL